VILLIVCLALAPSCASNLGVATQDREYSARVTALLNLYNANTLESLDEFDLEMRNLQKDYPARDAYQFTVMSIIRREKSGYVETARVLATELNNGSASDDYREWARGFLFRLGGTNEPLSLRFAATNGTEVDFSQMRGRVVLVDFWASTCPACLEELPILREVYTKYHSQGLEIIGINCDADERAMKRFLSKHDSKWPQYFDGNRLKFSRVTKAFGIGSIPHMLLVDQKGFLRNARIRPDDNLASSIAALITEGAGN
jgi:thiol-disulfide isomerase/thioredoxin